MPSGRITIQLDYPIDLSQHPEGTTAEQVVQQDVGAFEVQLIGRKLAMGLMHVNHSVRGQFK